MAAVFKRGGKNNRGGYWYVQWFDHTGRRGTKCSRTTDKGTAERIARKCEDDAAKRREGLIDPSDDRFASECRRTLAAHLADYKAALAASGKDDEYVAQTEARATCIIKLCEADYISDLTASTVQQAIRQLRDGDAGQDNGKSLATCNSYM